MELFARQSAHLGAARLALLKDVNTRVAAAAGVSPDDLLITLYYSSAGVIISPLVRARRTTRQRYVELRFATAREHDPACAKTDHSFIVTKRRADTR